MVNESITTRGKGGARKNPKSLRQRALAAGLPYPLVWQRVKFLKWSTEEALSTPKEYRAPNPKRDPSTYPSQP